MDLLSSSFPINPFCLGVFLACLDLRRGALAPSKGQDYGPFCSLIDQLRNHIVLNYIRPGSLSGMVSSALPVESPSNSM